MSNYRLDIAPYCDNCPEFEVCSQDNTYAYESFEYEVERVVYVDIKCKHQKRCANMVKWLEKSKGEKR